MFFFRKLFGLFFIGLLIFGLFGVFGRGGHHRTQEAYQQGFIAGQQAAAAENTAEGAEGTTTTVPNQSAGTNIYYRGHGFFFPGSLLLFCLMPFFLLGFVFMLFGTDLFINGTRPTSSETEADAAGIYARTRPGIARNPCRQ